MLKVALTQMNIAWEESETNKKMCHKFVEEASKQKADLILFPEMTLSGFSMDVEKIKDKEGETLAFFSKLAREYRIAIGFGYVTQPDEKGRNHFAVVDAYGDIKMDYIKIHPFTYGGEDQVYTGGDRLGTFTWKSWNCAGFICYDLRFPESFQKIEDRDVIFVIANWPEKRVRQWDALLRARAIEMQCYVVGVNRIGAGGGLDYVKSSVAYDPMGEVVVPNGDGNAPLFYVTLDRQLRQKYIQAFPVRRDRRKGFDYE